jgi:Flp pilus assembly protein TadG
MRIRTSSLVASRPARALARFWRCDKGVNAIEFAFVVPIIIAILLATAQIGVIFIAQAYLNEVAEAGMRTVLTNQANNLTKSQFATAICGNVAALFNCNNLIVALQQAPTTAAAMSTAMPQFDTNGNLTQQTTYNVAPAPAQMLLVVMYQWPVIGGPLGLKFGGLGNGAYLLVSTQVFMIEPPT